MNKLHPKITVITVCFNAVNTLEKTIQSVLSQTYSNIEYIIIDGGSDDGTINILKKYTNKISFWCSEHDNGIYDAMNKGISHSNGILLNFMNAGDTFVNDDVIEKIVSNYNGEGFINGNIIRCYKTHKKKSTGITVNPPSSIDFLYDTFHHQGSFISKKLFDKYGGYSIDFKLISDWKFAFDCIILHKEIYTHIDIDVAYFQMDGISSQNSDKYIEERKEYLQSIYGKEIYGYMEELYFYRHTKITYLIFKLKYYLKSKISYKNIRKLKIIRDILLSFIQK